MLLVDDLAAAEDVVQDVFVRLHRRGGGWRPVGCCDWARAGPRRRRHRPGRLTAEQARMWAAIAELPTRQRQVVVCRYYLDLSERDTARTLGVSAGTVKASTSRAMKTLAQRLGATDE